MVSWVMGYMAAVNINVAETDILGNIDGEGMKAWVDNYCQAHPLDTVSKATGALAFELLGRTAEATSPTQPLSQSEVDAMRARLASLWDVKPGIEHPEELFVTVRIHLGRDRRLSAPPQVVSTGSSPRYQAAADAAIRAVLQGQPYEMLRDETYDQWKFMDIDFDPKKIFRALGSAAPSAVFRAFKIKNRLSGKCGPCSTVMPGHGGTTAVSESLTRLATDGTGCKRRRCQGAFATCRGF
jgi:hypothetical protein